MHDLDFTISTDKSEVPASSNFDSAAALDFFKSAGKELNMPAGEIIFTENQKSSRLLFQRDKMYLLLDGTVELTANGNQVDIVQQGEIFGEMAAISQTPRNATATTKSQCHLISMDDKQFENALRDKPEFALTLMTLMANRLRNMVGLLNTNHALTPDIAHHDSFALSRNLLANLASELGDSSSMSCEQGKIIMQEGQAGALMYIVLEGSVLISIQGTDVEMVGPGGFFGEMALIERTKRMASATAASDCSLLAINHNAFINLVKDNPEFGVAILSAIGERVRLMISHLVNGAA